MAEYIDRQKVLDLTKTFALDIDWVEDPMFLEFSYVATNDIKYIPAADVRPVIFCKDCRAYDAETGWCELVGYERDSICFCSEGEKREES